MIIPTKFTVCGKWDLKQCRAQQEDNKIIWGLKYWGREEKLVVFAKETSRFNSVCELSNGFVGGQPI